MNPSDLTEDEKLIFDFAKENPPPDFKEKLPPWPPTPWAKLTEAGKHKARQVARLIGKGARVRYIDNAIAECEKNYLEQEGRTLWHIFRNYFNRNASK